MPIEFVLNWTVDPEHWLFTNVKSTTGIEFTVTTVIDDVAEQPDGFVTVTV